MVAVLVPFILLFIPSFLANFNSPAVARLLGLLPDQLLQIGTVLNMFNLCSVGEKVTGVVPVLMGLYTVLAVVILPVIYREYAGKEVG